MAEDYYKVLGVGRGAKAEEIQKAYRNLARKYHPDMNPDDTTARQKFQAVQRAYDVLSDPEKRKLYDQFGPEFEQMGAGAGAGAGPAGGTWTRTGPGGATFRFEDVDLSDLFGGGMGGGEAGGFSDFFRQFGGAPGGGPRASARREPPRGSDLHHEVQVPFQTAISGGEVQLNIVRASGKRETITAKIPAGISDGRRIRLRGQGESSPRGGPAGDLLIKVNVAPHPFFRRVEKNLEVTVPVALLEAAQGAKVDIPSPRGTVTLTVPPGTSSGRKLRLKGLGVDTGKGEPGDLLAEIQVMLPKALDNEDLELLRKIDQKHPQDARAELRW